MQQQEQKGREPGSSEEPTEGCCNCRHAPQFQSQCHRAHTPRPLHYLSNSRARCGRHLTTAQASAGQSRQTALPTHRRVLLPLVPAGEWHRSSRTRVVGKLETSVLQDLRRRVQQERSKPGGAVRDGANVQPCYSNSACYSDSPCYSDSACRSDSALQSSLCPLGACCLLQMRRWRPSLTTTSRQTWTKSSLSTQTSASLTGYPATREWAHPRSDPRRRNS